MTPDTPLIEVALHLPIEAAQTLSAAGSDEQVAVLAQIRAVIIFWEEQGLVFDPLVYAAALNGLVATLAPLVDEVYRLNAVIRDLQRELVCADATIRRLSLGVDLRDLR